MNKYSDCLHGIVGFGIFKYDVNDTNILVLYSLRVREREREKMKKQELLPYFSWNATQRKIRHSRGEKRKGCLILLNKEVGGSNKLFLMCILTYLIGQVRYKFESWRGMLFSGECLYLYFLESHSHSLRCLKCNIVGGRVCPQKDMESLKCQNRWF